MQFSNLLGEEPATNIANDEELTSVLHQLNFKTGPFTMDEYQTVKGKLKTEADKSHWDQTESEVLKRCDFDDIFFEYANRPLINQEKPK